MNFFRLFGMHAGDFTICRIRPGFARSVSVLMGTAWLSMAACGSSAPGTIGAALGQQADHRLYVRSMPPGQGAERAGLAIDDEILMIDGKDVHAMSEDDVRRAVRGDVGTTMTVTILRNGEKREVKVVRTPLLAAAPEKKEISK